MNNIPKVVFSKTLTEATWPESTIASGDLVDEITALRNQSGGEIIAWGGARFAQALSRAQLINKYIIITQPVAYGGGSPMFANLPDALHLQLLASTTYATGTTLRTFEPRGWGHELATGHEPAAARSPHPPRSRRDRRIVLHRRLSRSAAGRAP